MVKIHRSIWIPEYGKVSYLKHLSNGSSKVSDLITLSHHWDTTRIRSIFPSDISKAIESIPLLPSPYPDTYYWPYTTHGNYSVNSGYHKAHSLMCKDDPTQSDPMANQTWWKKMWTQPIPPKVKHFIWRDFYGILPRSYNLHKRKTIPTPNCCRCQHQMETLEHDIFRCSTIQKRNDFLHHQKLVTPVTIIQATSNYLDIYQQNNRLPHTLGTNLSCAVADSHGTPSSFQLKHSVDAAQNTTTNKTGFGMALFNNSGDLLLSVATPWQGTQTALLMEAHTLYYALSWYQQRSIQPDYIVSDCKFLVVYVCNAANHHLLLNIFAKDLKNFLSSLPNATFVHISREHNEDAHRLVKFALGLDQKVF
uniref:RNase H type-1 domain-containing protein n=1 Tax=Cannabis sativa TaxID=3483 RepID=A0A803QDA3_CANSA